MLSDLGGQNIKSHQSVFEDEPDLLMQQKHKINQTSDFPVTSADMIEGGDKSDQEEKLLRHRDGSFGMGARSELLASVGTASRMGLVDNHRVVYFQMR